MQAVFDRHGKAEPELYSLDTVHPTICGHMVIAGELLKAFMR